MSELVPCNLLLQEPFVRKDLGPEFSTSESPPGMHPVPDLKYCPAGSNLSLKTSDHVQSHGSARVSLEASVTDVLASVKLEVVAPAPDAPKCWHNQVAVSCCRSISAKLYG
ncbi:hypothetical protein PsorP6_011716 [Peronosclerospora sorghi]|uniref:Uncharacterized protein n=1 Tax=Peronosclerospora sorghi TaxID=230839 RepID=A0ACC0WKB3_9STRA|nr:hypothetical protein PsorP6_011716 [Peronosclerospora sorghi]